MRKFIKAFAMLAGIIIITQACTYLDSIGASADMQKKLHEKRLDVGEALLVVTTGGIDEILPYYSSDIEYHDPVVTINGKKDMKAFLYQLIEGEGMDLTTTVLDETLIDDTYCASWVMEGLFNGIDYYAQGISIFKFKPYSYQVYYQRDYYSEGDIMATIKNPDGSPGLDALIAVFREQYRCSVVPDYPCSLATPAPGADNNQSTLKGQPYNTQLDVGRLLVQLDSDNWTHVIPFLKSSYEYRDPIVEINTRDTMALFLGQLFEGSQELFTVVEDETLVDDIYMATWTMSGTVGEATFTAPGMSIVKFKEGTTKVMYSRDYYSEGDVMLGLINTYPDMGYAVLGFRNYYLCAVDPTYPKENCQPAP